MERRRLLNRTAPLLLALALSAACGAAPAADFTVLEGHGGPVKAIAVGPDGQRVLTASFDNALGLWADPQSPNWLEGHRAAVTAVAFGGPDLAFSGGDDFAVWRWDLSSGSGRELGRHQNKVNGLALSPDGRLLASASWDGDVGLWPLDAASPGPRFLDGHRSAVNAVAFVSDTLLLSASADGTIREWNLASGTDRVILSHGFGINTLLVDPGADWLAYGAVDGGTRIVRLSAPGSQIADLTLERRPILSMAVHDGKMAVGDGEGFIMVVDTETWRITRDFRAAARGPVWALAFAGDGRLYAGGLDNAVFAWPVSDPEAPMPQMATEERAFLRAPETMSNGERQFARKCSICHVLTGDTARRAGPTLEGLFGRPIGTVPGYRYSAALLDSDVVWSDETIDALFDLGPDHYLPGTKMPMQRIVAPEDRRDLIDYLRQATAAR